MHITDMMGQYSQNVKNGTEEMLSVQGQQKMVSTIQDLEPGMVFEGTVHSVKNGKAMLALGNGQMILARLAGKVSVNQGESMFFQVRSNEGGTIEIRPYVQAGKINNPILLNALTAAGLPVTDRSLSMVDAMMREQMSIGRQSILDMGKILNANPNVHVTTLVQMTKLGLPVSDALASQFENYVADRQAITGELDQMADGIAAALSDKACAEEDTFALYTKLVDVLDGKTVMPEQIEQMFDKLQDGAAKAEADAMPGAKNSLPQGAESNVLSAGEASPVIRQPEWAQGGILPPEVYPQEAVQQEVEAPSGQTLEQLLDKTELSDLKKLLQNMPALTGNTEIFEQNGGEEIFVDTMSDEETSSAAPVQLASETEVSAEAVLKKEMTAGAFLDALRDALQENSQYGFAGMKHLFSSQVFHKLLRGRAEEQWLLKPEQLKEPGKINELYEKLQFQMKQMENVMKTAGATAQTAAETAADIRGNVDFMNQINQVYTYVQLPLKMMEQNASGELYVYTNKKNLRDPEAELTAFLHLDLDGLGATDVSIRMRQKKVNTAFYIASESSYRLMEQHLPLLEKRLKQKGYQCTVTMTQEEKKVGFVEDFLQKDMPQAGALRRYSFDMRA